MRGYKVAQGICTIGGGEVVAMKENQYKRRAHNCEVIRRQDGGVVVRALSPLQFKAGEELGLKELPKNLVDVLVPLAKPKGDAEKVAVERHEEREKTMIEKIKEKVGLAAKDREAAAA